MPFERAGRVCGMQSKRSPKPLGPGGLSSAVFPHTVAEFGIYQGQLQNSHQAPQCWIRPRGKQTGNQQHRFAWCHWLVGESPFLLTPYQGISSPASRKTQWENHVPIKKCHMYQMGQWRPSSAFHGVFPWSFAKTDWQVVTELCLNSWITRPEGSILWLSDLQSWKTQAAENDLIFFKNTCLWPVTVFTCSLHDIHAHTYIHI